MAMAPALRTVLKRPPRDRAEAGTAAHLALRERAVRTKESVRSRRRRPKVYQAELALRHDIVLRRHHYRLVSRGQS